MSFDMFSSKKTVTQVANQQVGVQGSGVGISAPVVGGDLTIISSDVMALEANQAVSQSAILANQQVAIHALEALQDTQSRSLSLTGEALDRSFDIASLAAPQNPAAYAEVMAGLQTTERQQMVKVVAVVIVTLAIVGGLVYYSKQP